MTIDQKVLTPDAPWCWNICLHLVMYWANVGKYSSAMEHPGYAYSSDHHSQKNQSMLQGLVMAILTINY